MLALFYIMETNFCKKNVWAMKKEKKTWKNKMTLVLERRKEWEKREEQKQGGFRKRGSQEGEVRESRDILRI